MALRGKMDTKLQQVGNEKIAILKTDEYITSEQFGALRKTLTQQFPGYKVLICERVDIDFGNVAQEKIDILHTNLHDYLELVDIK